ncbi:RagB/SusD family nutrient uptake outer membrane protein [Pricia sp. S334]|uniref:RagB/SusD family nutrient uptake outer membrane protein n=1 Tax=Pricia mediterranea TaxID=3076079 RepID=A0ABU3L6F9_9FLAO|nr:RagB/SusD family nutrient uptake outer membrane protein [Pricia sp. S334]MDT7829330.1 RagB/SusD family nutrient uptake outer membrane protein [Pricia sp. S334]
MRHSIFLFALLVTLGFGVTSCDTYLEEEPRDLVSPGNFFNTSSEFELAIVGIYDIYKDNSLHGKIGLDRYYENGADVIGPNRVFGQVEPTQSYSLSESNIGAIDQGAGAPLTWQNLYAIVLNTNSILDQLGANENISQEEKERFEAEALFLRAYAYYHLTNLWGDVPYYRDFLPIEEIQMLPRTDKTMIRDEILVDLQQAQDLLPSSYETNDFGRASKWTAATLMVKIYLIQQKWLEARDKAVEIITTSPHDLLEDYAAVFAPDNEYNQESIWEIDFIKDTNSNDWVDHFTPRIRDEPKDPSKQDALSAALAERNEGFTGYGLAIPLPDYVNKFPMDDLRRPSNITTEYLGFELNFAYMPKMWNLDQINSPRGNHGDNKIIFRLADVYLMAAEAENELNGPAAAYQYINRVRERAYEPDQPLAGLSQEDFRQAIYDERKWELGGENHRRMDLIRWGILLDVVKNTEYRIYDPASNIQPHHVLLPIPPEELQLNPALLESDPTNNGYR